MKTQTIFSLLIMASILFLGACNSDSVLPKDELGIRFQSEIIKKNDSEEPQLFPQKSNFPISILSVDQPTGDSVLVAYAVSFDMDNLNPDLNRSYSMTLQFWKNEILSELLQEENFGAYKYKDPEIFFENFFDKKNFPSADQNIDINFRQIYQLGYNEKFSDDFNQVSIKTVKRVKTDEGDRLQIEGEFQCKILSSNPIGAEWFTIEDGVFRVQLEP